MRRTIHAVHLCWGSYGFWLPNDPRGSGSETVWADHLKPFGEATFVPDRKRSRARTGHDKPLRFAAKRALLRPAVLFNGHQAKCAALAFGEYAERIDLPIWACTVLPDHVHLVVAPCGIRARDLSARFKAAATKALKEQGLHPFGHLEDESGDVPKCWQMKDWSVFKYDPDAVRQVIRYVEDNPLKEGKPKQTWHFVTHDAG